MAKSGKQGRISQLILDGADHLGMVWNQALAYLGQWAWMANPPNGKNGMHFINITCMAEAQASLSELTHYGPTNEKALPLNSDKVRPYLPSYPDNKKLIIQEDAEFWATAAPKIDARWQAYISG